MKKDLKERILREMVIKEEPVKVIVEKTRRGVPVTVALYWAFNNEKLCSLTNEDALRLSKRIQLIQGVKYK